MEKIIEEIIHDIEQAPSTFINLALTEGNICEVYGPDPLGKESETPKCGFTDQAIVATEKSRDLLETNLYRCGSIDSGEGDEKAIPLMMKLARAGIIEPAGYSKEQDLTVWKSTGGLTPILKEVLSLNEFNLEFQISKVLNPDSKFEAGRALYKKIVENYK